MTSVLEETGTPAPHLESAPRGPARRVGLVITTVAVAVLVTIALAVPRVRLELRRSYTRLPAEYTELYFGKDPSLERTPSGYLAIVPVSVVRHGTGATRYALDLSLSTGDGQVVDSSTVTVDAEPEVPVATVVRLGPVPSRFASGATVVQVSLAGHPQTLHYRLDIEHSS